MHNSQVPVCYSNVDMLGSTLFQKNGQCTIITLFGLVQLIQVSKHISQLQVRFSHEIIFRAQLFLENG